MRIWNTQNEDTAYAPVSHILEGLTSEQAGTPVAGLPHSIYQELWHAALWQRLILDKDQAALERWDDQSKFPASPAPESDTAWRELVTSFLADIKKGEPILADVAALDQPYFAGYTGREALEGLAVHNAYHLARIVALRQLLGVWDPT